MKLAVPIRAVFARRRTPTGVRGLKLLVAEELAYREESHPYGGARVETDIRLHMVI